MNSPLTPSLVLKVVGVSYVSGISIGGVDDWLGSGLAVRA